MSTTVTTYGEALDRLEQRPHELTEKDVDALGRYSAYHRDQARAILAARSPTPAQSRLESIVLEGAHLLRRLTLEKGDFERHNEAFCRWLTDPNHGLSPETKATFMICGLAGCHRNHHARIDALEKRLADLENRPVHEGAWTGGRSYGKHTMIAKDGSSWISAIDDNRSVPGLSPDWRLLAQRGRNGRDARGGMHDESR